MKVTIGAIAGLIKIKLTRSGNYTEDALIILKEKELLNNLNFKFKYSQTDVEGACDILLLEFQEDEASLALKTRYNEIKKDLVSKGSYTEEGIANFKKVARFRADMLPVMYLLEANYCFEEGMEVTDTSMLKDELVKLFKSLDRYDLVSIDAMIKTLQTPNLFAEQTLSKELTGNDNSYSNKELLEACTSMLSDFKLGDLTGIDLEEVSVLRNVLKKTEMFNYDYVRFLIAEINSINSLANSTYEIITVMERYSVSSIKKACEVLLHELDEEGSENIYGAVRHALIITNNYDMSMIEFIHNNLRNKDDYLIHAFNLNLPNYPLTKIEYNLKAHYHDIRRRKENLKIVTQIIFKQEGLYTFNHLSNYKLDNNRNVENLSMELGGGITTYTKEELETVLDALIADLLSHNMHTVISLKDIIISQVLKGLTSDSERLIETSIFYASVKADVFGGPIREEMLKVTESKEEWVLACLGLIKQYVMSAENTIREARRFREES